MRYYRYGEPEGRLIGTLRNFDLYPAVLSPAREYIEPELQSRSKGEFNFSYGPSTGGMLESVRFLMSTSGEVIDNVSIHTEYKMRSLEIIGKSIEDAQLVVERINGFHAASHTIAYLLSIEDALGILPEDRVQATRIIEIELERIRSHLYVLSRMVEPAGFGVPLGFLNSLTERVTRLIGKYTGHRFFFGINGLNSAKINFKGIHDDLVPLIEELKNIQEALLVSGIFVDRLQGNGKIRTEISTGPTARSSGFWFDARTDSESLPYSNLGFRPVVGSEGDAYSRFMQRINEIHQSVEIIEKMETYSRFDIKFSEKNSAQLESDGTGIARIESPGGDLTYLIEVRDGIVKKLNLLTPSEINLQVFLESMKKYVFTDFHFNWESFGIWISELAVKIT